MIELAPELVTILMFVGLLAGLAMGMPLGFVLGGLAVIFGYIFVGPGIWAMFAFRIVGIMSCFILVAVPMFILMAVFLDRSGVAEDMFESLTALMGRLRGGLVMSSLILATVFAACTGIMGASVVAMTLLALPIMLKSGYDKRLATGSICAGGSLGILIPPSVMLIFMADMAGVSVGKLFAGAFIPGLLLSLLYLIYVAVICWRRPELAPAMSQVEMSAVPITRRLGRMAVSLVPPVVLILGVLGSIIMGIATPTEAAGVGAIIAMLMTIVYRRFSWKMLMETVIDAGKATSMVMIIVIGASCFTGVFLTVGGGDVLAELVVGAAYHVGMWGAMALMMLLVILLGALIDWIGIIFIIIPVFMPLALEFGWDPIWFLVVIAVNLQTSLITPPFGYAIFYLKGVASKEVTTLDIYRGIVPFLILMLIGLVLTIAFPQLVLFLPNLLI